MSRSRKMLRTLLIAACAAGFATYGTFAAFSASTQNDGNQIAAGTVALGNNNGTSWVYNETDFKPGVTKTKCVQVTYSGSLDADVKLYVPSLPTTRDLEQYVNLKIDVGTPTDSSPEADCSDFDATPTNVFNNTLKNLVDNRTQFSNGLPVTPEGASFWTAANGKVVFKFEWSLQDVQAAAGKSVSAHTFKWEAQNR